MASVGQDLLNVPFPQMVMSLAKAVADGQRALDKSSVETTRILAKEKVSLIEEIHEVVEARPFKAKDSDGNDITDEDGNAIMVTGATVTAESTEPKDYSLIQAGLFPTFYQFTESIIEVKMSISSKTASTSELDMGIEASGGWGPVHVSAHVNFKTSQTYSYSAEGSSLLRTTLKPVPPPARITPRIITVNTLVTPPTVTSG
jgi:hypothetical protein